ncbi:MAG: dTDP-4-dehydrorhamnose 3,5-epimerase [Patescibacteria group bacterium]|nr:dTDP-4-dehydrorhamnose 3,5-epimerase [Patescibacteria group bacterium]
MTPNFIETKFKEAFIIEPKSFDDARGYFTEAYNINAFKDRGIGDVFIQDNLSFSLKGVLRGLHFQKPPHETSKLVQCTFGEIFDVIVDIRPDSPTFKQWESFILSRENKKILYVPKGFAHGFYVTSEYAVVTYKVDEFFYPDNDGSVRWNDPDLNILWPTVVSTDLIISDKDKNAPFLKDLSF